MELLCSRLLITLMLSTSILCSPAAWDHQRKSPADWGLRPGPGDDLPVPDLIESPNKLLDPRLSDLNTTFLLHKLGRHFDAHYMSVTHPRHHTHTHNASLMEFPIRRNAKGRLIPVGEMPDHLRKMNYKFIRLPDGTRLRTRISPKLKKKLQQFLWAYTACPVVYRWRDLGVRFWPRYLKEGSCPPGKTSCSIPPGMKCRPAAKGHKTLLRYNCRPQRNHRNLIYSAGGTATSPAADVTINAPASAAMPCEWIEVKYPIVTKCSCSCPNNS